MILLPQPHTVQPQGGVVLDRNWARKIAFASITGAGGARDLVSGLFPTLQGTVGTRATEKGLARYTGSVASGLVWSTLTPIASVFTTGMAFLMYANPAAQGTLQRAFFLGDELPAVSNQYNQSEFAFNCDKTGTGSSGVFSAFEYNFGFQAATQSTAGAVDGNWHVFIATRPAGHGQWTLYRDGVNVSGTATPANGVVLTVGARVHIHPGNVNGYMGNSVLAVAFNGPLSATEVSDLSVNPWRIIEPEPYWILPVAGSGPAPSTFQAAWARNSNSIITGAVR